MLATPDYERYLYGPALIASDGTEYGWIIGVVIIILSLVALAWKGRISGFSFTAGPVRAKIDVAAVHRELVEIKEKVAATQEKVEVVGESVNHRREGEPTLAQTVKDIAETLDGVKKDMMKHQEVERQMFYWQNNAIGLLANHVDLKLPAPPKEFQNEKAQ